MIILSAEEASMLLKPTATCCFTGHRVISKSNSAALKEKLNKELRELIDSGISTFIAGGALGFDTLAAITVLKLREEFPEINLLLALPCKTQTTNWTRTQKKAYNDILAKADYTIFISENYTPECMRKRNRFMVDNSSAVIAYLNRPYGGTAYTVGYAFDQGKEIINIDIQ